MNQYLTAISTVVKSIKFITFSRNLGTLLKIIIYFPKSGTKLFGGLAISPEI